MLGLKVHKHSHERTDQTNKESNFKTEKKKEHQSNSKHIHVMSPLPLFTHTQHMDVISELKNETRFITHALCFSLLKISFV